ncbi:DUF6285 domain-containing protein [Candidatus Marimicrobium litorale]|uniref:DUF6285 domain-containing protein n=1 Tax=Candidatus Marimicrobium litorale TaxID=2518991 RepID=A0ABT3T4R0_9GAMM|nr:DUF6285 domain-containing protein [Candidatus Marimicrobium litorale]MCX2977257.1 hypothetical protein [Candidatus Marimicrobium litorale]
MSGTDSEELLAAVRAFLKSEVLGELDGFKAYQLRVAANALGIVERELALGEAVVALDREMAAILQIDNGAEPLPRIIAQRLKACSIALDERVLSYLRRRAQLVLAIDNPRYSGLQQSLQRWGDLTNMAD